MCFEEMAKDNTILPGLLFRRIYRTISLLTIITGFLVGLLTAGGVLNYSGVLPVNVFVYSGLFVFLPLVLTVLPLHFLFRLLCDSHTKLSVIHKFFLTIFTKSFSKNKFNLKKIIGTESRDAIDTAKGIIKSGNVVYGSLLTWPLFILGQLFGILVQTGVLVATFMVVLVKDVAFGWQSTLQISSENVFLLCRKLAFPWRWLFGEGVGYPGLSEIKGSHIILKDSISHLASNDLISWWPFLCFCVFFYGLLPRLFFFLGGWFCQYIVLQKIQFNHCSVNNLVNRMSTPLVSINSEPVSSSSNFSANLNSSVSKKSGLSIHKKYHDHEGLILLISEDIEKSLIDGVLVDYLTQHYGYQFTEQFMTGKTYELDQQLIADFSKRIWSQHPGFLSVVEGWMAPVNDTLDFLNELRQSLGKGVMIRVILLGKSRDNLVEKPSDVEWKIWQNKLRSLGDPWLSLEPVWL